MMRKGWVVAEWRHVGMLEFLDRLMWEVEVIELVYDQVRRFES